MAWVLAETTTWDKALEPDSTGMQLADNPAYLTFIMESKYQGKEEYYISIGLGEESFSVIVSYDAIASILAEHNVPENGWMNSEYSEKTVQGKIWVKDE